MSPRSSLTPLAVLLAALPALSAASAGTAPEPAQKRAEADPVAELEAWTQQVRRNGPAVGVGELERLEQLVADLRMLQIADPARRQAVVLALLDLAGMRTNDELRARRSDTGAGARIGRQTDRIRDYGREALDAVFAADTDGQLARWIAFHVLSSPSERNDDRRIAALEQLTGRYLAPTMLPTFDCAIGDDRELRDAAMDALVGWPDDAVHRFMLQQLERLRETPGWISRRAVRVHFAGAEIDPASDFGQELIVFASAAMLGRDWREAYHGIQLMGAIRDDPAVPALIEALAVWLARRERGEGSRRIESELMRELERRSGRRIGAHPERWAAWWKTKSTAGATAQVTDGPVVRTHAGFFGLRPVTDRVVFVIDRSGSMSGVFGAGENTRYGEAIAQMLAFLRELGPSTRFRVVLFSTDIVVWKDRLQPANEGNLRAVERWLRYHPPAGATNLKPAVEHVFRLDGNGRADVGRIEEDSVVVLCDGVTASGSAWVRPLLERTNDDACLAFHCVQIGGRSDGTLETLAAGSGGDYVTVTE